MGLQQTFVVGKDYCGVYHPDTDRSLINLPSHETVEEVMATCVHETIHYCISKSGELTDEEQEEDIIFRMQWAPLSLA